MVRQWNRMVTVGCAVATGCLMIGCRVLLLPESAWGELQVTEIMFNPKNADTDWEWVEIRNAGTVAVDLDNYWFDDVGPAAIAGSVPHIRHIAGGGKAVNTVIPAGQVAVLYDGAAVDFNDDEFRANWDMAANTHLIAVEFFPSLNNLSSTNPTETFAIWSDETAYRMDTADVSTTEVPRINVVQTSSALLSFTYDRDTFPSSNNVASIYWTGVGDGTKGENWLRSEPGQDGAITSLDMTTTGRSPLNSADDLGSPGEVPFGSFADGVSITEIMYNPRSGEPAWEWVEVYNNTGATIDFAETNYVLDDDDSNALAGANVTSGSIPQDGVAVLFNGSSLTVDQMQQAWGADVNFVPVQSWPGLANDGDVIALWSSFNSYGDRSFGVAEAFVEFGSGGDWPTSNGAASIFVSTPGADATMGGNWRLAGTGDDGLSFSPNVISAESTLGYPGGDVGSPGFFPGSAPTVLPGDYNRNGVVDAADYTIWKDNFGSTSLLDADGNNNGTIDAADYTVWKDNFGNSLSSVSAASVPEPGSLLSLLSGLLAFSRLHCRK